MIDSMIICYKHKWIVDQIYEESERLHTKLTDPTKFEDRCIKQVATYLKKNKNNFKHRRYISKIIKKEAKSVLDLFSREMYQTFSEMAVTDDNGEEIAFEPIDVLANVESEVMAKEIAALLGQDGRRKVILEAWSIGNTNGKSISRTLARTIGGNVETHRKFIQRFESECQKRLKSVV